MTGRGLAALAVLVVLAVACGDAEPAATTTDQPASLELRIEGGIEGRTDTWVLDEDGTLLRPPSDVVDSIGGAEAAALFDRIAEAGFFDLDAEYLPDDPCCDFFSYRLEVTAGGRSHTVVAMDTPNTAPDEFFAIVADIRDTVE